MKNRIDNEEQDGKKYELPLWFRFFGSIISLSLIIWVYKQYQRFDYYIRVVNDENSLLLKPSDFGLREIAIIAVGLLFLINIPWHLLSFRIKKIGNIELEHIVDGQAQNHAEEIADLQVQIDNIINSSIDNNSIIEPIHGIDGDSIVSGNNEKALEGERNLHDIVFDFLKKYDRWSFSPLRIIKWGGERKDFEELKLANTTQVRKVLRRLVHNNKIVTTVSKKTGNTLYIYNKEFSGYDE